MKVEVNQKSLEKFKKFVKLSYPNECCGFLLGVELVTKTVVDHIYIPLDQEKYATPDKIDLPDHWFDDAEELAKEKKIDVVGFIHSHPDYRDVSMSEADLAMTDMMKTFLPEVDNPVMGIVGVWKAGESKRLMTKVGLWPMFNQHKICLT